MFSLDGIRFQYVTTFQINLTIRSVILSFQDLDISSYVYFVFNAPFIELPKHMWRSVVVVNLIILRNRKNLTNKNWIVSKILWIFGAFCSVMKTNHSSAHLNTWNFEKSEVTNKSINYSEYLHLFDLFRCLFQLFRTSFE